MAEPDLNLELKEFKQEMLGAILALSVRKEQERYVGPNALAIAKAHFAPEIHYLVICVNDAPVGFLMLYEDPTSAYCGLWHLMIDAAHQTKGYGKGAMRLLVEYLRTKTNARQLLVHCLPGKQGPEGFYLAVGFKPTGRMEGREIEMRLTF